jgi:hypothetical protein
MTYFTQGVAHKMGTDNTLVFCTEQHPKKRENQVGILTIHVHQHIEGTQASTPMMIKCCKVEPVLTGNISKDYVLVGRHKEALQKFINAYLYKQYKSTWLKSDCVMAPLSDSLYVLGVHMTPSEAEGEFCGETKSVFSAWKGGGGIEQSQVLPTQAAKVSRAAKKPKTGAPVDAAGIARIRTRTTVLEIKFCRVDDVPMIMQACRVFFRQAESSGARTEVVFARGEMPMWWKLQHDTPFDFKKTRDSFENVEVVEQIRTRRALHSSSCFMVQPADITFSTRVKSADGSAWVPVIYVDFSKLVIVDRDALFSSHKASNVVSGVASPTPEPYDPVTHDARLHTHLDEYSKCIVWCIKAGSEYHPAFEHKHQAPCNVGNFYFGQCPWLPDGTVNPPGVPPASLGSSTCYQ